MEVASAVSLAWRRCFSDLFALNEHVVVNGSPLLSGEGFIQLVRVAELFGVAPLDVAAQIVAYGLIWVETSGQAVQMMPRGQTANREHDGRYILSEVIAESERGDVAGWVAITDSDGVARGLTRDSTVNVLAGYCPSLDREVFFHPCRLTVALDSLWLKRKDVARMRVGWAEQLAMPARTPSNGQAGQTPTETVASVRAMTATARPLEPRVKEVVEEFLKSNSQARPGASRARWKPDEAVRNARKLGTFMDFAGDLPVSHLCTMPYGQRAVEDYMNRLLKLPTGADMRRAQRELGGQASATALIDWAEAQPQVKRMEARTAKAYVTKLSECFTWARDMGYMTLNPAQAVVRGAIQEATREDEQRDPFTEDDLARIFSVGWYQHGAGLTSSGRLSAQWRPYYYWLPLLGLYTGGRLNEVAQLYLADVVVDEPVPYVWFRVDQADKMANEGESDAGRAGARSLKTEHSRRQVPIHPELIRLGLRDYVRRLQREGYKRLFPELTFDPVKGYGKPAGSWFNERFLGKQLGMARDGRKVFHSFRHNFADRFQSISIPPRVRNQLMGHQRGEHLADRRYSHDLRPDETVQYIEQMSYRLPCMTPFDVDRGLAALRAAIRVKDRRR